MILYYTNYSSIIILAFIHNVTLTKALKSPNQFLALTGRLTNQVLFSIIRAFEFRMSSYFMGFDQIHQEDTA